MTAKQPQPAPEGTPQPPKKEPRLRARRPTPEQQEMQDWAYMVTRRGISGTADLLKQMHETIEAQQAKIDDLEELIAKSADATAMQALREENARLKSLLAGCYDTSIVGGGFAPLETINDLDSNGGGPQV